MCCLQKKRWLFPSPYATVFLVAHTGGIAILLTYSQKLLRPSGIFTFLCTTKNNQLLSPKMSPKWCQKWYIFWLHFLIIFWLKKLSIFFVSRRKKWNAGTEKSGDTFWHKIFFEISCRKFFSVRRTPGVFLLFWIFCFTTDRPFRRKKNLVKSAFFSVFANSELQCMPYDTLKNAHLQKLLRKFEKKRFFQNFFFWEFSIPCANALAYKAH